MERRTECQHTRRFGASFTSMYIDYLEKARTLMPSRKCRECGESIPRAHSHACLECQFIFCDADVVDHARLHALHEQHHLMLDLDTLVVRCHTCRRVVFREEDVRNEAPSTADTSSTCSDSDADDETKTPTGDAMQQDDEEWDRPQLPEHSPAACEYDRVALEQVHNSRHAASAMRLCLVDERASKQPCVLATPFLSDDVRLADLSTMARPVSMPPPDVPLASALLGQRDSVLSLLASPNSGRVGYNNLGNTCFLNAALQVLLHVPHVIRLFGDQTFLLQLPPQSRPRMARQMLREVRDYWSVSSRSKRRQQEERTRSPREIFQALMVANPMFGGFGQHDSTEALHTLLDQLHEAARYPKAHVAFHVREQARRRGVAPVDDVESARGVKSIGDLPSTPRLSKKRADIDASRRDRDGRTPRRKRRQRSRGALRSLFSDDSSSNDSSGGKKDATAAGSKSNTGSDEVLPEFKRFNSPVYDTFQGLLQQCVTCTACGHESHTQQPFLDVPLALPSAEALRRAAAERGCNVRWNDSLSSKLISFVGFGPSPVLNLRVCLHAFCTSEEIGGSGDSTGYRCEQCSETGQARKQVAFEKLPEVLCISLKRFSHNRWWGASKRGDSVQFPLHGLDLSEFVQAKSDEDEQDNAMRDDSQDHTSREQRQQEGQYVYDLCGLINHSGGTGGGHYVAMTRHPVSGRWFKFDDDLVSAVSESEVASTQAYYLVYTRRRPKPLTLADLGLQETTTAATSAAPELPPHTVSNSVSSPSLSRNRPPPLDIALTKVMPPASSGAPNADDNDALLLSRRWLHKLDRFVHPGPIDNAPLLCAHGRRRPSRDVRDLCVPVPRRLFDALAARYGDGVRTRASTSDTGNFCAECAQQQLERHRRWIDENMRMRQGKPGDHAMRQRQRQFVLSESWLRRLRDFIKSRSDELPGPIANLDLMLVYIDKSIY
ncbi:MAG: hypothetical protein MHM6MM_006830, partial [Cercozoa sp. M6MM]